MIYNILDKYIMNDFSEEIVKNLNNNKNNVIFDIGCFKGNFSRTLKNKLNSNNNKFYLFDPNSNLKIEDFKHHTLAFSNKVKKKQKYHLNTFFPSSGSSLKTIVKNDKSWNLTRKILTFNIGKKFQVHNINTDKVDNFCKSKKISKIDVLKIDVEGAELDVLLGAKKMLSKTNIIQVEILESKINFKKKYNKIISFLRNKKFSVILERKIFSVGILSNIKSMDVLLKRNK